MEETSIFRAYDIRGIYGKDLNEDLAEKIGKSIGTFFQGKIGIGRDVRASSDSLHNSLVKGILSTGSDVIDFGVIPTPTLYFAVRHLKLNGGVIVTASHLPPEWNGFKTCASDGTIISEGFGLERIKEIYENKRYTSGSGSITKKSVIEDYIEEISSKININRRIKAVFDFANSVTSLVVPQIAKNLGIDAYFINDDIKTLPNRPYEPDQNSLSQLSEEVIKRKADVGIAYDGDGDRVGFVDEKGRIFASGNITIPLFAMNYLKNKKGKVVFDITCSSAVSDFIEKLGGEPVQVRVGHAYCVSEVKKQGAIFGGQYSGHLVFPEMNYSDDAMFPSMKLIEMLSSGNKKLSEYVDMIPVYPTTEIKQIECDDNKKFEVIEKVKGEVKKRNYKFIDIDGVKIIDTDGWVLIRASNTSPIIRVNAEGKTMEKAQALLKLGEELVRGEI
ncbi:MAG: phosphomannomutase/phosphoglucomutase [Nanoarchaeota archaeon]|nr:phosphomannomutase/phosphoglucomutase [Nanoarchaeota archaeon]